MGRLSRLVRFGKRNKHVISIAAIDEELVTTAVNLEEDEGTHASDANCIVSTMLRFASRPDAIVAVTGFITEVNWTSNVREVPLLEVCSSFRRSFEILKDGGAIVRPGMKGQACSSAKALLYPRVQRLCVGATDDAHIVATSLGPLLLGYWSREDHELASTLQVLDVVFNGSKDIPWGDFLFSNSHCCWLSHIIRCRAWVTLRTRQSLTKDVFGFIRHSFSEESPPPRVTADCLLVVNIIVGKLPEFNDRMLIKDKRLATHCDPKSGTDHALARKSRTFCVKLIGVSSQRLYHTLRPQKDSVLSRCWSSWRP